MDDATAASRPSAGTPTAPPLDASERDALRDAVTSGVFDGRSPAQMFTRRRRGQETVEIRPYDFKRPERIGKEQMRALNTLHETFARSYGAGLSGLLRTIVEISVQSCEQVSYAEFISRLPNPTSLTLLHSGRLEGHFLLDLSPTVIYPVIDRLLGGSNREIFVPQRPMTPIEMRLVRNLLDRGVSALAEAWQGLERMDFTLGETESNPQLVQVVPPNEVVVAITFDVKLGTCSGPMRLCLPYNAIEPLMDRLNSQSWLAAGRSRRAPDAQQRLSKSLSSATLTIDAVLAETTMTVSELRALEPGDIIVTTRKASAPATLRVEGRPKFHGRLGQSRGRRAVAISGASQGHGAVADRDFSVSRSATSDSAHPGGASATAGS
ncbi:MAG: flagellar motor switch protein FliM [Phycisphaeraceae bacterium]|nr:flagellar motor switch protein FliM [Phycisphaeraceae bacterium]